MSDKKEALLTNRPKKTSARRDYFRGEGRSHAEEVLRRRSKPLTKGGMGEVNASA